MARTKKKHMSKRRFTVPVSIVGGAVAGGSYIYNVYNSTGSLTAAMAQLTTVYTGYNPATGKFNFGNLRFGLMPLAIGMMVHYAANWLGINRALGRVIPILRV